MSADSDLYAQWGLRAYKNGVLLQIRVHPNARQNGIEQDHTGLIRVRLNASPIKGAANKACIHFLSEFLKIPRSQIEIVRGLQSKEKYLGFKGMTPSFLAEVLSAKLT